MLYVTATIENNVATVRSVHSKGSLARVVADRDAVNLGIKAQAIAVQMVNAKSIRPRIGDRLATVRGDFDIVAVANVG